MSKPNQVRLRLQLPRWALFGLLVLCIMQLASCNSGSKYVIPADSVALSGCPIPGVSLPPGTAIKPEPPKKLWRVHAQINDWDGLIRHLNEVMNRQGYHRVSKLLNPDPKDARSARYEKRGARHFLVVVMKEGKSGYNCIITAIPEI